MFKPNELDLAQLKHEFREVYKEIGYAGALQVLYEMMVAADVLMEVIQEEQNEEKKGMDL